MKEILITSSVLIVALLALRLVFAKKVSRRLIYGAWILVALRLLIPIQIGELDFSVLTATREVTQTIEQVATRPVSGPSQQEVYKDIVVDYLEKDQSAFAPQVQEQIRNEAASGTATKEEIADKIQQNYPQQEIFAPQVQQQVQQQVAETVTAPTLGQIATVVWLAGVAVMAVWFTVINLRYGQLLRRSSEKLECESPIPVYVSEKILSPCLVGQLRPAVYLTPGSIANEECRRHVLTHELTHYHHGDHIWSLVRCLCLCVYWFNPLVWVAAWVSRRDCELACDEGALKRLGEGERIAYGKTLLAVVSHAATPSNLLQTATAMTETMKQLKERVNFIVRKPKISLIAVICMVLICAIIAGCVAAGPASIQNDPEKDPPATTTPTSTPETSPTTNGTIKPTEPKPTDPKPTDPQPTDPVDNDISWNMEGTLLLADGTVDGSVALSVTGTIQDQENGTAYLVLDIIPDDSFRYLFGIPEPNGYVSINRPYDCKDYYVCHTYCYDKDTNDSIWSAFAIDPEKGYIILTWEDGSGRYLVASADSNVDVKAVYDHFAEFREKYAFDTNKPEPPNDDLAKFNALFGDRKSWYNMALTSEYTMPAQINLEYLFYNGFADEPRKPTDSELAELKAVIENKDFAASIENYEIFRLPVEKMNQVLTEVFGITLEDVDDTGFDDMYYLKSTNCYYLIHTDALWTEDFNALAVEYLDDGTIRMTYTQDTWREDRFMAILMPYGDGYRILSNIVCPASTTQPLPDTSAEELAKFNALFGDWRSWYNRALVCQYSDPSKIQLRLLFYLPLEGETREPTDAEWEQLKDQPGFRIEMDLIRLPVDKMNQVLMDLYGITLEDVDEAGFENLVYLESTNCYYHMVTDALFVEDFKALSVETLDDGAIRLTYKPDDWWDDVYVVTLMPYGDGYRILSNVRVE